MKEFFSQVVLPNIQIYIHFLLFPIFFINDSIQTLLWLQNPTSFSPKITIFPISGVPHYLCGLSGTMGCQDTGSAYFWSIAMTVIIILFAQIFSIRYVSKKTLIMSFYLSFYLGLLIYLFVSLVLFPPPQFR